MRIKQDFVTNSSSTSFTFIFKGGKKENLLEAIKGSGKLFNLKYLDKQCSPDEIAEDVKKILRKRKHVPEITTLDFLISKEEQYLQKTKEDTRKMGNKKSERWFKNSVKSWSKEANLRIKFLKELKEKGFDSSFSMSWANQPNMCGHVNGGNTGECMHSKGPKKAVRKNLAVYNVWGFAEK